MTNYVKDLKKSEIEELFEGVISQTYLEVDVNQVDIEINPFSNDDGAGFTVTASANNEELFFCKISHNGLCVEVTDCYTDNRMPETADEKIRKSQKECFENRIRDEVYKYFIEEFGVYYVQDEEKFFNAQLIKAKEETMAALMKYKLTLRSAGVDFSQKSEEVCNQMTEDVTKETERARKEHKEHMKELFENMYDIEM